MLKRIAAITAVGLAFGLAACDQAGQEQAETPNRSPTQQEQGAPPAPPSAAPEQPAAPATPPEQAPSAPPPSGGADTESR